MSDKKSSESKQALCEFSKKLNCIAYGSLAFLKQNFKKFLIALGPLLLAVLGYFGYEEFYVKARQKKALEHLFYARQYFSRDEIKKALGGESALKSGGYMGFSDIIEHFPSTKAANIARFYAGLSHYKLGNYQKALELWKDFSAKDDFLFPMKYGMMGDAYIQLDKNDQALDYYIKAARARDNDFTSPLYFYKAAVLAFKIGNYKESKNCFIDLKEKYPKNVFLEETEKYLSLIELKLQK